MKGLVLLAGIVLMAGVVARADERASQGEGLTPGQVIELEAQAAAQGKTREQLNEAIEELAERVVEKRSELQQSEAVLRKLKNLRDTAQDGEPVRREFGVPTLHGGKKLFRNIGVGTTPETGKPDHERRLEEIERKLDRVLKELDGMKGRPQAAKPEPFTFYIGAFW